MTQVFAQVGGSLQVVGGDCPDGFIEMNEQRPGLYNLAQADGTCGPDVEPVPTCTSSQGKRALNALGLYTQASDLIRASNDPAAEIEWGAPTWEYTNPFLQSMWAQLGQPAETLADAFRLAVTL